MQVFKGKSCRVVLIISILAIALLQANIIEKRAIAFQEGGASDSNYAIYGEVKNMMDYISKNSAPGEDVYITGRADYFSRFYKPLLYLGEKEGVDIQRGDKEDKVPIGVHVFRVQKKESARKLEKKTFHGAGVENYVTFGKVSIINFKH